MNCRDAAERITALVDGELPPAEREELERHLSGCAACREARAAEEAVAARLRAAPRPPLPAGFSASVMARVGNARPKGRILPLWPLLAAASAVAAAVVAMVVVGPGVDRGAPVARPMMVAEAEKAAVPARAAPAPTALPPDAAGPPATDPSLGMIGARENDDRERKETKPAAPVDAPAAPVEARRDKARSGAKEAVGEDEASEDAGKVAVKDADEEQKKKVDAVSTQTRIALNFKVPGLVEAQQSVEGVLLANRGLATRGGAWKAPMEGTVRQEQNRTLLLQVRPENLEKLREVLDRASGLQGSTVALIDRGDALPVEVARLLVEPPAEAAVGGKSKADGAGGFAPVGGGAAAPEPVPPPKPSAEQLKKLAEAPAPAKEGPTIQEGDPAEVLVEIQLETTPVAGPPATKPPAGTPR